MTHEQFNQFCSEFMAATYVQQWGGSLVWKVAGKVFALGTVSKQGTPAYTFKTSPLNFDFLSHHESYIPAPYMASRGMKWIQQIEQSEALDEELRYYIEASYKLVCQSLSKKKRTEFGISLEDD
jgi:predicted DNA-binding protein (MmcQ/YjbR family)